MTTSKTTKSLTTRRIVAQFYTDMSKNLLLLLAAYALFGTPLPGSIVRPIAVIVILLAVMSAAYRAQLNMDKIDEEEKTGNE